jgi:exonuclease SbcD
MRFLHTADWHIGKPLRGRSRFDEFAEALDEIVGIARDRRVDAVLLAGDVFD